MLHYTSCLKNAMHATPYYAGESIFKLEAGLMLCLEKICTRSPIPGEKKVKVRLDGLPSKQTPARGPVRGGAYTSLGQATLDPSGWILLETLDLFVAVGPGRRNE